MTSENDATATMAPASGEKSDRNYVNTDQPHYSPNPQDTKRLCADGKDAIGRLTAKETSERANSADSKVENPGNAGCLSILPQPPRS
jgi:hypothetical protein